MRAITGLPDAPILAAAGALIAAALGCGFLMPPLFGLALTAAVGAGILFLAMRMPVQFCVAWLLITGMSLEMTISDLAGDDTYQPSIAVIKGIGIGLAVLCAIRYGPKLDLFCPVWAYCAMFLAGFAHGLFPGLGATDTMRSMIGSAAPFAFCFCRLPRHWSGAMIRAARWCPIIAVVACLPLAAAGIRPLFIDSGGARLAGLGHPAFLAGVCLPAIYACLIQLYRDGRRRDQALLIINGLILILTGARAPLAYATAVTALSLISIPSTVFRGRDRMMLILLGLTLLPLAAGLAGVLEEVRLFNVVLNEASNLSGRSLLWPLFENAAARSPWFGWGIGSGNAVIPSDSRIVQILHTSAAHNEYLRIQVEGGMIGEALLIAWFAAWVIVRTSRLRTSDRRIMRLVFVAFACHAFTDNVLISTPACVLFAFAAAVFAEKATE